MNNQMITHASRPVPPGAIDVWSQNQNQNQLGFMQQQPANSPATKVKSLLRGRVALAIVLAAIGGIVGGAAGFLSQSPSYRTLGLIQINPTIPVAEGDKNMPYYQQFMHTQALTM